MSKDKLTEYMKSPNIAELLDDAKLSEISHKVIKSFTDDDGSRQEWLKSVNEAIDLAKLKTSPKTFPSSDSANIAFPLITTAALQFNARTYPEIIKNGKVVLVQVIGKDPDGVKTARADRVSKYMSYQLLTENDEWEQGTDSLLAILPVVGTVFRKTYFDPTKGQIRSEVCLPDDIVVNHDIPNLDKATQITHQFKMTGNDLMSKMRAGMFSKIDLSELHSTDSDSDTPNHLILEQHRYLDLDGDGYEEPYIVTMHKDTMKILRIVARFNPADISYNDKDEIVCIEPVQYFTDYHFVRSPDGKFYSLGFGTLLLPINKTMNSLLNLLMDSGVMASMQAGYIGGGAKVKAGEMPLRAGELRPVDSFGTDLKSNIVMVDFKEPSPVLFKLLEFLLQEANKLTSVTDTLSGSEHAQNSPATTITTLVEQGLKVFTAIMRRQYWSFKKEFSKIYRLNSIFLDPQHYMTVLDEEVPTHQDENGNVIIDDFEADSYDIKPISDPNISSETQRTARLQLLMQLSGDPKFGAMLNDQEILKRVLEQADVTGLETLMRNPEPAPPDPKMMQVQIDGTVEQGKLQIAELEIQMKQQMLERDMALKDAQVELMKAQAMQAMALADAAVGRKELDILKLDLAAIKHQMDDELARAELKNGAAEPTATEQAEQLSPEGITDEPTEPTPMAPPPSDQGVPPAPPGM